MAEEQQQSEAQHRTEQPEQPVSAGSAAEAPQDQPQAAGASQPPTQAAPAGAGTAAPGRPHAPARAGAAGRGGGRQPSRGGRGGQGQGGRPGRGRERERERTDESGVESSVVRIYRCSKVVKGGRTFSFGALVVAGDRRGNIGIGYGKANEVPGAVEKATKDARKTMFRINLKGTTIPHTVRGQAGASTVVLVPARPGTGVTAGKSVRPVLELSGISDILTKAYGSTSPKNLVKATVDALQQLQNREQVEHTRGVTLVRGAGELVTA
jgi:small subunit ribosomal protein S5